eukprot:1186500-Prorocentrum_minimum.AAC.6
MEAQSSGLGSSETENKSPSLTTSDGVSDPHGHSPKEPSDFARDPLITSEAFESTEVAPPSPLEGMLLQPNPRQQTEGHSQHLTMNGSAHDLPNWIRNNIFCPPHLQPPYFNPCLELTGVNSGKLYHLNCQLRQSTISHRLSS